MKRVFKICAAVFFLSAFQIPAAAENRPLKAQEALHSDFLYAFFLKEGFEVERQYLQNTMTQDFPYNVLVSSGKKNGAAGKQKRLIISCPQQDAAAILPRLAALIRSIGEKNSGFESAFVFTANDYSSAGRFSADLQAPSFVNSGTYTYINSLETKENTAVFIIRAGDNTHIFSPLRKRHVEIIPGARGEYNRGTVIPRDFFKLFTKACLSAGVSYSVRDRFLSLYRIGFSQNEGLVSAWLSADIPALMLLLTEENPDVVCSVLEHCAQEFTDTQAFTGDRRYSFFTFGGRGFFISEYAYVLFLSVSAALTLFLFFIFSFIRGAHRYIHREEFFKTWYLIPLILGVTAALLYLAQFAAVKTAGSIIEAPLFFLTVKTLCALIPFTFVFFPFAYYTLKLPLTGFIYGYLLSVSAFLNIFLFAAVDLALIPVFIFEYIIIYISRSMRRLIPLILCSLCMLIPYMPFIQAIASLDTDLCARFIGEAPLILNLLYAAVLLPFQIMIIRMLIRFKSWKRRGTAAKKMIRRQAFAAVSLVALFLLCCLTLSALITSVQSSAKLRTSENKKDSVSLVFERTAQFGRSLFTLKLSSGLPVMRYYIEITSSSVLPVFESNYPYDMFVKPSAAVFALDDYPPEPFVLTFSADGIQDTVCRVTALVQTDGGIKTERLSYTIAGIHK
ncbi:hypothetical protein V1L52_12620 [Treponema sp. HNW]|uniref:hypothetical protein n=1 Tax=Treponema sp. HNW TaxID=3116654 RepID=UPI003D11DD5D